MNSFNISFPEGGLRTRTWWGWLSALLFIVDGFDTGVVVKEVRAQSMGELPYNFNEALGVVSDKVLESRPQPLVLPNLPFCESSEDCVYNLVGVGEIVLHFIQDVHGKGWRGLVPSSQHISQYLPHIGRFQILGTEDSIIEGD